MESPTKIKILRIIARLNIGGPAIHTILLTSSLNNHKFSTTLACGVLSAGEGDMSYYAREKGVNLHTIFPLKRDVRLLDDYLAFREIHSLIVKLKPDIIHTHTAKAGSLGRLAALAYNLCPWHKRIKIVHTFHGHVLSGYFSKFQSFLFVLIEKFLATFTDQIITVSESVKNELIGLGIGSNTKIRVIALGLELEKFLALTYNDKFQDFKVGIIGRLVPIKNQKLFLDAAAKISRDYSDLAVSFKVVGDGEDREMLKKYAGKLGIRKIDFLGWEKNLADVYSGLNIVALTSLNEGTPVSLIEAMASCCAVVSTNVGGVKDLVGDEFSTANSNKSKFRVFQRGVLLNADNADCLADAIVFLLKNKEIRRDMGISGRDYVRRAFSKERLVMDMEYLYEKLVI